MVLPSATIAATMDWRLILVVVGVIAGSVGRSEALTCYACSTLRGDKCSDPFDATGPGVNTCGSEEEELICTKVKWTSSGR